VPGTMMQHSGGTNEPWPPTSTQGRFGYKIV
jgi:hypothetical protein